MIIEIKTGRGFRGALSYIQKEHERDLFEDKKPEVLERSHVFGDTKSMANQMRFISNGNPRVSKPVIHLSINFSKDENISEKLRRQAVQAVLKEMGVSKEDHQYFVVKHNDTSHPHYHIVLNKVDLNGNKLNLGFNGKKEEFVKNRLQVIADKIEQEHGLRRTKGRNIIYDPKEAKGYRFLTKEEKASQRAEQKTGFKEKDPNKREQKAIIKKAVTEAFQDKAIVTADQFKKSLESKGIDVRYQENKNGISGVSFKTDKISVKGSLIGVKWSDISKVLAINAELTKQAEKQPKIEEKRPKPQEAIALEKQVRTALQDETILTLDQFKQSLEKKGVRVRLQENKEGIPVMEFATEKMESPGMSISAKLSDINKAISAGTEITKQVEKRPEIEEKSTQKIEGKQKKGYDIQEPGDRQKLYRKVFKDVSIVSAESFQKELVEKGVTVEYKEVKGRESLPIIHLNGLRLANDESSNIKTLIELNKAIQQEPVLPTLSEVFREPTKKEASMERLADAINRRIDTLVDRFEANLRDAGHKQRFIPAEEIRKIALSCGYTEDQRGNYVLKYKAGQGVHVFRKDVLLSPVAQFNDQLKSYQQDFTAYRKLMDQRPEKVPLFIGKKQVIQANEALRIKQYQAIKPEFKPVINQVNRGRLRLDTPYRSEKRTHAVEYKKQQDNFTKQTKYRDFAVHQKDQIINQIVRVRQVNRLRPRL